MACMDAESLTPPVSLRTPRAVWMILLLALALRLITNATMDTTSPYLRGGGDTGWFLAASYTFVTGQQHFNGMFIDPGVLGQPPVFYLALGIPQALTDPQTAIVIIRVTQALAGTLAVYFGFRLAQLIGGRLAGMLAALILAIAPALVLESAQIKTETLYICFVMGGIWLMAEALARLRPTRWLQATLGWKLWAIVTLGAVLLGLAAMTRAVFILYPVGLAAALLIVGGPRRSWRMAMLLTAVYVAVISSWTIYNLIAYQRLIVGGNGLSAFIYLGAMGWDGFAEVDERLGVTGAEGENPEQMMAQAAQSTIFGDLPGYIARRLSEWSGALLQPHGTEYFGGASLRALALDWWRNDRSPAGLGRVTQQDAFGDKLSLYVFHYAGLVLGLIGIVLARRQWRASLPAVLFIAYTLAVHLVLLALPRYFLPILPLAWVFAAVTLAAVWRALRPAAQPSARSPMPAPR